MKTSPGLIVALRLKLMEVQAENKKLGGEIASILRGSLDNKETEDIQHSKEISNDETQPHTVARDILRQRMTKVNDYKLKKETARINIRSALISRVVDTKRVQLLELRREFEHIQQLNQAKLQKSAVSLQNSDTYQDTEKKLTQVRSVLTKMQTQQQKQLFKWFTIGETNSNNIRYVLSFQPVISIRIVKQLPTSIVHNSLYTMRQYLDLLALILGVSSESLHGGSDLKQSLLAPLTQVKAQIPTWLAQIALDTITLCKQSGTLTSGANIDISQLLSTYDVDGIFFALANGSELTSTPLSSTNSPEPGIQDIAAFIADL